MFKNIFVPLINGKSLNAALSCAAKLAKHYNSLIRGQIVLPIQLHYVSEDELPSNIQSVLDHSRQESLQTMRQTFLDQMRAEGIRLNGNDAGLINQPSAYLEEKLLRSPAAVGWLARVFDISIAEQPLAGESVALGAMLDALLFDSGRPVLLAPPNAPDSIGEIIAIAWNGSSETARTIALAMPLLERAKEIHVLSVRGFGVDGPSGDEIAASLRHLSPDVKSMKLEGSRDKAGKAFLDYAREKNVDLLLKGAYTHSRLHQSVFGGTTKHVIENAETPVFMSH